MKPLCLLALLLSVTGAVAADERQVTLLRPPGRGIQPQAVIDANGILHVLYFEGQPMAGNLMYVRREVGKFGPPLQANSQEGSAVATGTIRGGHIALGKDGRVHVSWNGSGKAVPKNPITGHPMLYTRLNEQGTAFEPQRNLMTQTSVLDGGGSLAADSQGNVYVAWHALGKGIAKGEENRGLWVSISHDEGRTFTPEMPAWKKATGACGCCGIRGFADRHGNALFLYRGAGDKVNRGMYVVRSADNGTSFDGLQLDHWKLDRCPMSSEAFAEGPDGVYAAWDTDGQIFFTRIQTSKLRADVPKAAPGPAKNRKHPALAVNRAGEMILVWTEGTGWNRGGALAWQVYDKEGNPTSEAGRRHDAIPVWGLPTVVAETDGRFTILH